MAAFGCTPASLLTVQDAAGKTMHIAPGQPLLYEPAGNVEGPVPTYAKFVFREGIIPAHSVSTRVFPAAAVGQV